MSEFEENLDLHKVEVEEALLGAPPKKKPKARKSKSKESSDSGSGSSGPTIPLWMLPPSSEDISLFEAKEKALKGQVGNAKAYAMKSRVNMGDIIKHKKFGLGFVILEVGLNKVEVLFKEGRKMLITLAKPSELSVI